MKNDEEMTMPMNFDNIKLKNKCHYKTKHDTSISGPCNE